MLNVLDYGDQPGLGSIFDGVDACAAKIYDMVYQVLNRTGLEAVRPGASLTLSEFQTRIGADPRISHRVPVLVEILEQVGAVELCGENIVVRKPAQPLSYDDTLVERTYGEIFPQYLQMYRQGLFLNPDFHIAFDVNNDNWDQQLRRVPLNQVANNLAIEWAAAGGPRGGFMDLGFGPTYALERLRQLAAPGEPVVGVDLSAKFCQAARARFTERALDIRVVESDLNQGLREIEAGTMRGVMFVGAMHFIEDPAALMREVHRVLVPNGHFSLGMSLTNYRSFSAPAFRLHGTLLNPPALFHDVIELEESLRRSGFEVRFTTQFGPFRSMYAERR